MDFDVLTNVAVGLFILGLVGVMVYERFLSRFGTDNESRSEQTRDL